MRRYLTRIGWACVAYHVLMVGPGVIRHVAHAGATLTLATRVTGPGSPVQRVAEMA